MNENDEVVMTEADDDWDDISFDDLTDIDEEANDNSSSEDQEPADQPENESGSKDSDNAENDGSGSANEQTADQTFELKHLDETKTVNRDEVISLAQKGMDYDRIRAKLDSTKEATDFYEQNAESVHFLEELAKEQGMTLGELVDNTRATLMSQKTGQNIEVCKGIVANERKSAELEKQSARLKSKSAESETKAAEEAKKEADIRDFIREYPEQAKDPNALPKEVWDAVHNGETLVNAYRAFENRQLKEQLAKEKAEAERKALDAKNKARSTGSQASRGQRQEMDDFDRAWYDGT